MVQSKPTKVIIYKTDMLLDYIATNLDEKLTYFAGNRILQVDSDTAYLVVPSVEHFLCS